MNLINLVEVMKYLRAKPRLIRAKPRQIVKTRQIAKLAHFFFCFKHPVQYWIIVDDISLEIK
jgi:hypothetical protein